MHSVSAVTLLSSQLFKIVFPKLIEMNSKENCVKRRYVSNVRVGNWNEDLYMKQVWRAFFMNRLQDV